MQLKKLFTVSTILATPLFLVPASANAADFEVTNGQTVNSTETLNTGDTLKVDTGGAISTPNTIAVNSTGTSTITNGGTISNNAGTGSYVIYNTGANTAITNNGTISSSTQDNDLIRTTGTGTQITNNGSLSTTAFLADGIVADNAATGTIVINNGSITLSGDANGGFYINSDSATSINNGTINTGGGNSIGMITSGVGSVQTNNGSITTTGDGSDAMQNRGTGATLLNTGTIHTSGTNSNGMDSIADNATLTNNNSITTTNGGAYGMTTNSTGNYLINNGNISTSGASGYAMYANGSNNNMVNNGTINNVGNDVDGMMSGNGTTGNVLTNNGKITVDGVSTDGMNSFNNATLINNGTITALNTSGNAMRGFGDNDTLINNGTISSSARSIEVFGDADTVILGANSKTLGDISFNGTNGALEYDLSGSTSRAGSVASIDGNILGTHTTSIVNASSLPYGAKVAQGGNSVAVVTPDSFAGTTQVISQTLAHTGDIINQRQQSFALGENIGIPSNAQLASNTSSLNDAEPAAGWGMRQQNVAWSEAFGSYQERPQNSETDFSRARAGGGLAGLDFPQTAEGYRSGFYVGGFAGSIDIGSPKYREIDSTGGLAGLYISKALHNNLFINGQLALGYVDNNSDRYVSNTDASANYQSYFLSPSVTIMRPYKDSGVTWVPSAMLRYTLQHDSSYNEKGSAADQQVDSVNYNALTARGQIEAKLDSKSLGDGLFEPSFRAGIEGQTFIGNRSLDLSVLGTNMSFDPSGDNNYVDGIIGVNITYAINGGPEVYLDGEAVIGLNKGGPSDNFGGTGRTGLRFKF